MKVRLGQLYCECGHPLFYIEDIKRRIPRRRLLCRNEDCEHHGKIFLEPLFELEESAVATTE